MLKNRKEMIRRLLFVNDLRNGAEVGVATGRFSKFMFDTIPGLSLICVDDWANSKFAHTYEIAKETLKGCNAKLIKKTSVEAAKEVENGSLDFVYIDANHEYNHVVDDIASWYPKVRSGGVVCGDDYYLTHAGNTGVIRAVQEFCRENGIEFYITDWDFEQEIEDDRQPNWYFIKP